MIQVITDTGHVPGETDIWLQLLHEGASGILVRKPGWQQADYERLLSQADPACYPKLMIAAQPRLCGQFNLQGLHFGEIARGHITDADISSYQAKGWSLSTSIHSTATIQVISNSWDQLLLGPVFNSISKQGHMAVFDENFRLHKEGFSGKVLALGGVNETNAGKARTMQFDGIALLGAVWGQPENAVKEFCRIRDSWRKN